jgi:hypothetical protein
LVEQVLAKSRECGISALQYTKRQPLPAAFHDGKSVLVGAYETPFSGRSKFGLRGSGQEVVKAGAIILDDAHVVLGSVRSAFTLNVTRDHEALATGERGPGAVYRIAREVQGPFIRDLRQAAESEDTPRYSRRMGPARR